MKNYLAHNLIKFFLLFFISFIIHAGGNESESFLMESLDEVLIEEYKPCSDQSDINSFEVNTISSLMIVSDGSFFTEGEVITSSSGVQAIVDSYDDETQKLTYHQNASTGFETFVLNETITGNSSETAIVKEFVFDLTIPCSELIVSIEEEPQQMIFIPKESLEEAKVTATIAAAEMMAEIEEEVARQAALEAFQKKLAEERAAAAASTAAYQSKLEYDAMVAEQIEALERQMEIDAFEAQLEAELAAQEMMAEILVEEELAKRLAEFQAALEAEKAAAARSTAIYQARQQQEQMIKDRQAQLALEREIAAFEAELAVDLAEEALERELSEFETQLEEDLANQAALAEFLAKLAEERAAAAASTAAYQSKLAYDARVAKIMKDLMRQLEEEVEPDNYKSHVVEKLIAKATAKLEEEKFIGSISGEIVTVAIHEFCQDTLNLSDSNIELFKKALVGGYLGNVGPQVKYGTEFTANRWEKYITCVGSLGN